MAVVVSAPAAGSVHDELLPFLIAEAQGVVEELRGETQTRQEVLVPAAHLGEEVVVLAHVHQYHSRGQEAAEEEEEVLTP